ncbi:glycosyltransferase family 4 protein [Algoriphagus antarcticus]|uniref:Glycosyltransferase involved in cell wall biosynthesis n=1 Tax=Algoriphagus antarcticus TaxID=238540 RepID=A0A3E0DZV2_9BACT|nr:glycosyltransferase family 4 protein [Algoriphagus antarcticus]REG91528.1 glycosyltransferase involved in cell wall biosynthesis [Algoriphagus antarcticus]
MKIIQLIQKPQRRGAEIFAAQLSEQLMLSGHEVLLVSIFEGDSELPFKGEWIKLNRPISNRFFDLKAWRRFAQIVKQFQPDIIQANAADTLKFSVLSKKLFGWKNPIVYRNANQMGDFIRSEFHRQVNQRLIDQVTATVSVSNASAVDFKNTFKFPENKSVVIPIGIDPKAVDFALSEKLEVDLPKSFLLQIGGLVPEKDPLGMLAIFREVVKHYPDLSLVFLGSGVLKDKLGASIGELSLESKVLIFPSQTNIFSILSRAKALVMPSKIEGLPGVILEAMYCKVAVVAYDVGGISEVLKSKETGWLVEAENLKLFKESIVEVLDSPSSELERIISAAKALVLKNYQIVLIAKEFERFYFRLLKSKT